MKEFTDTAYQNFIVGYPNLESLTSRDDLGSPDIYDAIEAYGAGLKRIARLDLDSHTVQCELMTIPPNLKQTERNH